MTRFGYHASHEQYPPSLLLEHVRAAEAAGFARAMCSDHFHPWTEEEGHSGFAWSWLGAALQATALPFGVVNAPGWRYHPAIIAQAAATLAEMFSGRFWLAVGSGEALNEGITGEAWPPRPERNARLGECVDVMRALWRGETVTHRGRVCVEEAKLYSRAATPPPLFGAALSEDTAEFCGRWADGLMTIGGPRDAVAKMIAAFRRGGGEGKPVLVQHSLCWAPTDEEARRNAHQQWRFSPLGGDVLPILRTPKQFAAAARFVTADDVAERVRVSADPARHVAWLREYVELGVDEVYLFNVGKNQRAYIEAFAEHVLPELA
ncbi:MAG TPA: TIGR03885 family FMN-dependent LLM class oxidoreductase [Gemmatimonadaceae bacterium]|nr:TIGR03885 family FMN-dependent LLM class oxidoreductase [Gemmatimonadaceae bacterium]